MDSGRDGGPSDETMDKLRLANKALRYQLKEFSKSLDASLASTVSTLGQSTGSMSARDRDAILLERRRLMHSLQSKDKQLHGVQKKLDSYKRANSELKRHAGNSYNADRLASLQAERDERDQIIKQLQEENRTLMQIQRSQSRKIHEHENQKNEWPSKVSSLMADLRVSKERVRKAKEREHKATELTKRQHEQMMKLAEKNKRLQKQLVEYEHSQGSNLADKQKKKLVAQWQDEKERLHRSIAVLEKSKEQERSKGERLLRANVAELQKVKKEMEKHRSQLEEKEKEIRLQLLQVRKLKRQLRELALGEAGAGQLTKGWSGQGAAPGVAARGRVLGEEKSGPADTPGHASSSPPPRDRSRDRSRSRPRRGRAAAEKAAEDSPVSRRRRGAGCAGRQAKKAPPAVDDAQQATAATSIQAAYRGRRDRSRATAVKREKKQQSLAATKIQARHRGKADRQRAKALREAREAKRREASRIDPDTAATRLQSMQRGRTARREYAEKRRVIDEQNFHATKIQAVARGQAGRRRARDVHGEEKRKKAAELHASHGGGVA